MSDYDHLSVWAQAQSWTLGQKKIACTTRTSPFGDIFAIPEALSANLLPGNPGSERPLDQEPRRVAVGGRLEPFTLFGPHLCQMWPKLLPPYIPRSL